MTKLLGMDQSVTLADAKAHLSAEAEAGHLITVTRHGRPVARIVGPARDVARTPGDRGWEGAYDKSARE